MADPELLYSDSLDTCLKAYVICSSVNLLFLWLLLQALEEHQDANQSYLEDGIELLELASKAREHFDRQKVAEKRRLLDVLLSNYSWKGGELTVEYRQPFNMIAESVIHHQKIRLSEVTLTAVLITGSPPNLAGGKLPSSTSSR